MVRAKHGRLLAFALVLGLVASSCKREGEVVVKDSEGRTFTARCRQGSPCALTQTAGPKAEATRPVLEARGRVIGVCDASGEEPPHPADCRPLSCSDDNDCPPLHAPATGSCLNGICVDPSQAIGSKDSVMLCLAGQGLGHSKREQVERYALGLNCGSPCVIPMICKQL
jgi:hypothetical protein